MTDVMLTPFHSMEIEKRRGELGFQGQPQKVLLFGTSVNAVSDADTFSRVSTLKDAKTLYGETSKLYQMVKVAFDTDPFVKLYANCLGQEQSSSLGPVDDNFINDPDEEIVSDKILFATSSPDFSKIPDEQFTQMVLPEYDSAMLDAFVDELDARWGKDKQIDGHLFVADASNTQSTLENRYNPQSGSTAKQTNSKHVTVLDTMGATDTHIWATVLAVVNARYASTPSRPYSQLELPGLSLAKGVVKSRSRTSRNTLLSSGVSTIKVSGGRVFIDRLVTTYKKDPATDQPDPSYRDLNAKQTLSAIRYDWITFVNETFYRFVISQDESQSGDYVATPKSVFSLALSRHELWKQKLLTQDPLGNFAKNLTVQVTDDGEHFYTELPVHLVGQLRGTHTKLLFKRGAA